MPSKTAIVLANQGDPIFGAIARLGARLARPAIRAVRTGLKSVRTAVESAFPGGAADVAKVGTAIAKSKTAQVAASTALTGTAAFVAGRSGARSVTQGQIIEGEFISSATGCPTGKIVNVAAHQRIIPIDRFGRPRRRINVLNTKALSRATRRLGGFQKRARKVEKMLQKIAPRSRGRSRRKVC